MGLHETTLGILEPRQGFERFTLVRRAPTGALCAHVDWYWIVRWKLAGQAPYEQHVLPYPSVNLSFEARGCRVNGVSTRRSTARIEGDGWVLGVKFKPGAFTAFTRRTMKSLVDRAVTLPEAFERDTLEVEQRVTLARSDDEAIEHARRFLESLAPAPVTPALASVQRLVALVERDRTVSSAARLAREARVSVRSLHRAFERYLGVGTRSIIRRARVQDAADRVAHGERVDWAALACELGYHDQSHLIRDFKSQVGDTPSAYAARCRGAAVTP
jgi:AraC-like DNA-binding protein